MQRFKQSKVRPQQFLTRKGSYDEFSEDLCNALIGANIPIEKLENEGFKNFLSRYCRLEFPCANTIRKIVPQIFQKVKIQVLGDL